MMIERYIFVIPFKLPSVITGFVSARRLQQFLIVPEDDEDREGESIAMVTDDDDDDDDDDYDLFNNENIWRVSEIVF